MASASVRRPASPPGARPIAAEPALHAAEPRPKLAKMVAEGIVRDIAAQGWREGASLGTESQLIARYRVSRATLREAVRELERHGAVRARRGVGLAVAAPARETVVATLASFIDLNGATPAEVGAVRDLLLAALPERSRDRPEAAKSPLVQLLLDALRPYETSAGAPAEPAKRKLSLDTAHLIADALSGRGAGERLGTEADFLQAYAVSRATLREAFALLESQGLVIRRRGLGGGLFRGRPDPRAVAEMAATYLHFLRLDPESFSDGRDALEPEMAALAARRAPPEQIARLRETLDRSASLDPEDREQGRLFHILLAECSGNPVLSLFVQVVMGAFYAVGLEITPDFVRRVHETHVTLFQAIEAHDAEAARRAMQVHLQFARSCLQAGMLSV